MEFVKYLLIGVSVSLDELAVGTIKGALLKLVCKGRASSLLV